jgi:large subunit ribosomal protein L6
MLRILKSGNYVSRIGKNPISIPEGVTVEVKDNLVTVKGKLGELTQDIFGIDVKRRCL